MPQASKLHHGHVFHRDDLRKGHFVFATLTGKGWTKVAQSERVNEVNG